MNTKNTDPNTELSVCPVCWRRDQTTVDGRCSQCKSSISLERCRLCDEVRRGARFTAAMPRTNALGAWNYPRALTRRQLATQQARVDAIGEVFACVRCLQRLLKEESARRRRDLWIVATLLFLFGWWWRTEGEPDLMFFVVSTVIAGVFCLVIAIQFTRLQLRPDRNPEQAIQIVRRQLLHEV